MKNIILIASALCMVCIACKKENKSVTKTYRMFEIVNTTSQTSSTSGVTTSNSTSTTISSPRNIVFYTKDKIKNIFYNSDTLVWRDDMNCYFKSDPKYYDAAFVRITFKSDSVFIYYLLEQLQYTQKSSVTKGVLE